MRWSTVCSFSLRYVVALVLVTAIALGTIVVSDRMARKTFARSDRISIPALVRAEPGKPANYLLIGSDTREVGGGRFGSALQTPGRRSDVMMVLHVDPATRTGILVSFPRDLIVDIPGYGRNLLNAAFQFGGPNLVIKTLQANFPPLRINHYVEVDFAGFSRIVDAIGKVPLWFPTPAHDPYSGLNIDRAGCVRANGEVALAYARSRHYYVPRDPDDPVPWDWNYSPDIPETAYRGGRGWVATGSDLDRIPRQQYFLRTVSQAAVDATAANPARLVGLLDRLSDAFARDDSLTLDELKALIRTYNRLDPRRVEMLTLPVTAAPAPWSGQVVATDEANGVVGRLMEFGGPVEVPDEVPRSEVRVRVVNGTGVEGAAKAVIEQFRAAGFSVAPDPGEADRTSYGRTQIRYAPGRWPEGFTVANAVGTLNFVQAISEANTLGAEVLVVVGRDYDSLRHAFVRPGVGTTTSVPTGATGSGAPPATGVPSTTTSSVPIDPVPARANSRFVPVDPETGGPLVGCPS
ncbi:MAG: LCP family protein [Actinomycetota bacterium]